MGTVFASIAVLSVLGASLWMILRKAGKLYSLSYRAHVGYSLSLTVSKERITLIYDDGIREPIVKYPGKSCYENIIGILNEYDFASWSCYSDKNAAADGYNTLEIRYAGGKTLYFSQSQNLPEKAQGIFQVINTCLLEYAGIFK